MEQIQVLIGLGNPESRYRGTRHNLGFDWIDRLARHWKAVLRPWRDLGKVGTAKRPQGEVLLAKPMTYMNHSGRLVATLLRTEGWAPAEILVGFDDHALPLGQIRLRRKGSSGGHNGMQSVIDHLGGNKIPRLRMGVGPLPKGIDLAHYVLSQFRAEELQTREAMLKRACTATEHVLDLGLESAMNEFNP